MTDVGEVARVIHDLRQRPEGQWDDGVEYCSTFGPPASEGQVRSAGASAANNRELREVWSISGDVWLFIDTQYEQGGVHLLPPQDVIGRTEQAVDEYESKNVHSGDAVVLEFLGDRDLVIYCPSEPSHRRYLGAVELYDRHEWYELGDSLAVILSGLRDALGEKYWERHGRGAVDEASPSTLEAPLGLLSRIRKKLTRM